jgi:hypothetical protein
MGYAMKEIQYHIATSKEAPVSGTCNPNSKTTV